jgi:hypothetical protein
MGRGTRHFRLGLFFATATALIGLLIWHLLYAPVQTPMLAIAATVYEWPLPPNSWAAEDVSALIPDLNGKTIELRDLSSDWRSADRGLARFDEALKQIARQPGRAGAVILYLSMHGGIDGEGRPCLIPPGAAPHESESWLPLATLFKHVSEAGLPRAMHKLLVLDCSRQPVNWHIGQVAGGFTAGLPSAVEASGIPNLAVLSSASAGESTVASPSLRGSVFGHYFRLGLAGAADDRTGSGNGNGRVSLQELEDYLARHVYAWVVHHRGHPQTPKVFPAGQDFDIAWTLRRSVWSNLVDRALHLQRDAPAVAAGRIMPLWQKLEVLRAVRPWRYDPIGWRDLEQRLLWLEQLSAAGPAYTETANSVFTQVATDMEAIERRLIVTRKTQSLPDHAKLLTGENRLPALKAYSLPLAQLWATADRDVLNALRGHLDRCQLEPTRGNISATLAAFGSANVPLTDEATFLAICQRLHVPGQWPNRIPLAQTLQARELAERHAVPPTVGESPGDERAHSWVRAPLASLDDSRRELEDAVLLGPAGAGNQTAGDELIRALQNFTLGKRAAQVFALRDELWAELPYLAQWACRKQFDAQPQDRADLLIRQTLLPLIAAGIELEDQLARSAPTDGEAPPWNADSAAALVEQKLGELKSALRSAIAAALADTTSAESIREIDAILTIPTLPWDVREQLSRQRLEVHLGQTAVYDGPFDSAGKTPTPIDPAMAHTARVLRWQAHPALWLLNHQERLQAEPGANSAAESMITCGAIGETIRQRLLTLSTTKVSALTGSGTSTAEGNGVPPESLESQCQAESNVRTAAGLWFPRPAIDPVHELRRSDLQEFFLWRAQRALNDFYGPATSGREPLFATSAADYLAVARALGPFNDDAAARASKLDSMVANRRVAAKEALAIRATDILLVDQAASVGSELVVTARTPESVVDLPPATATIFLADELGRLGKTSSLAVPSPSAHVNQPLLSAEANLETAGLANRGPILNAVASIRGNDLVAPVLLRAPGGVRVEFTPPVYGPPQVTVLGHERKRASVVFILDCSHSMQDAASVESPDALNRAQSTRMEVAKRALNMLLADLADRGTLRVGVRLFGHRVGWSTTEASKLLRQTAYADEIPADLRPFADVESVLPLGRFDSIAAGKVLDKLQTARAWGESPIHLAIQQAIADFGTLDNSARSIVVITDGKNYQFNPPRESQPQLADVLSAAQRARIAIHIVGFDMPDDEARAAAREFTQIAARTGGSYAPVAGATELIDSLQRLLRPGEFRVADASGDVIGQAELGQFAILDGHRGRQPYQVTFESLREPVELAGGEAVELAIRRGEPRLEVIPYLKGSPRFEPLISHDNGAATPLQAGIHRTVRTSEGVQLPISIQHTDGHFVPRPAELWVEVTPLGLPPESSSGPFIFYDASFAAATTVPVANLLARSWPALVGKAEVRVWAKSSLTPTTEERSLSEVADRLPEGTLGHAIAGISGINYQVRTAGGNGEPLAVGLVERHDRSESVGSLKVMLSPQPQRATHQFDPQNRVVVHTFTYDPASADRARILIQFTTRENALAHSIRSAQPVIVDVSDRSDLLELSPAVGR